MKHEILSIFFRDPNVLWSVMDKYYFATHIRIQGWLCGVICGYIIIKTRKVYVKIPHV